MTTGIALQAQAPAAAGADLGFWLASQIIGQPMAMTEHHLAHLVETISANRFTLPRNRKSGARITEKGTAIVEVHGILIDRAPILGSFWGLTAYEGLAEQFRRLATHDEVKRIVLDIDSPGGLVRGIEGCSEALERLAAKKPVHAIAHNMACSAAYWLGCVAETMSVAPGGEVGSIGIKAGHVSYAEQLDRAGVKITMFGAGATKNDRSPYALLSDGEFAERTYEMERHNDRFVAHVAANRPMSADEVRDLDARCFGGEEGMEAGLADRVECLEDMIERLEKSATRTPRKKRSATEKGSKAGMSSPERRPAEPDEDEPAAGQSNPKGATLMSEQTTTAASADLAEQIASALKSLSDGKASATAPAATTPAVSAAAPDATQAAVDAALSRVFAVLGCDEAKDRPKLAMALARSGLGADAAKAILAAAPAEAPPAAKAKSDGDELGDALARQMAKPGNSGGIKPDASAAKTRRSFVEVAEATAKKTPA